jgi:hypothetical protein
MSLIITVSARWADMTDTPDPPKIHVHRVDGHFGDCNPAGIVYQVIPEDFKALCRRCHTDPMS